VKSRWVLKSLGEVLKLEYGKPLPEEKRNPDGKHPVYGANGEKNRTNEFLYNRSSIIVGRKGSAGEVNLTADKFWPLDVTYYVTFNESRYDLFYLYYLLSNLNLQRLAKGVKPGINRNDVYAIKSFFPPLPEQKRIVSILDEALAAIDKTKENAQKNHANARELFESYLNRIFSNPGEDWEERKLLDIGITSTGTTPKTSEKENFGNYIPFIKPSDVDISGNGELRYDNEGLSEIGLKKGRKIDNGSILMVCIGSTIGKVGFAAQAVSCNQQINSLTVDKTNEPKFFYYSMTSKKFQEKVMLAGKGAQATLPIINKTKWENLTVSFPMTLPEQNRIVAKLDALSAETKRLENIYRKKIADLDELKKSILDKAFQGEL
jgi:type I restriction enzyme S subunit